MQQRIRFDCASQKTAQRIGRNFLADCGRNGHWRNIDGTNFVAGGQKWRTAGVAGDLTGLEDAIQTAVMIALARVPRTHVHREKDFAGAGHCS